MKKRYEFKILLVGDLGVGKTSILRRFVHDIFSSHYKSTIGVDFALKVLEDNDKIISLQLWDIAGQERFSNITRAYYKGAMGAFVVYDVTRPKTFENVLKWKKDIDEKVQLPYDGGNIPTILLANKIDTQANSNSSMEMKDFCAEYGFIQWFETSAKENKCVLEAAKCLMNILVELEESFSEYENDNNDTTLSLHDSSLSNKADSTSSCCS